MSLLGEDNVIPPNVPLNTFDEVDDVRQAEKRVEFHLTRLRDHLRGWASYKRFEGGGQHRLLVAFLADPRNKLKYEEVKEKVKLFTKAAKEVHDDDQYPIIGIKDVRSNKDKIEFLVTWEEDGSEDWLEEERVGHYYLPSFKQDPINQPKLRRSELECLIYLLENDDAWNKTERSQEKEGNKNDGATKVDLFDKGHITNIRYTSKSRKLEFFCSWQNGRHEKSSWLSLKNIIGGFGNNGFKKFKEENEDAYDKALESYNKDLPHSMQYRPYIPEKEVNDEKKTDGKITNEKTSDSRTIKEDCPPRRDDQPGPSKPKKRRVEEKDEKKTKPQNTEATPSFVPDSNLQPKEGFFKPVIEALSGEKKELAKKQQEELKTQLFNTITKGVLIDWKKYIVDGCPLNLELANGPFIHSVLMFKHEVCLQLMIRRGISLDNVPEKYIYPRAQEIYQHYQKKLHEAFDILFKTEFSGKIEISKIEKLITVPTHWLGLPQSTHKFYLDEEFKNEVQGKLGFVVFSAEWKEVEGKEKFVVTTALPTQMELAFNGTEVYKNSIHPNIANTSRDNKPLIGHLNKLKVSLYGLNKKMPFFVIMPVFITAKLNKRDK